MKRIIITVLMSLTSIGVVLAQGTAFSYQGQLNLTGEPATGLYDMQFYLYAAARGGGSLNSSVTNGVPVTDGLFTAQLNFGMGMFDGNPRWIELRVKTNGAATFTTLTPRQQVLPTPYATYAARAGSAANGSVSAAQLDAPAPGPGQLLSYNGTSLVWQNPPTATSWNLNGNNSAAGSFLGTINNQPLELKVNNVRALRLEPGDTSANVIGGSGVNMVGVGVTGATIGGGGWASLSLFVPSAPNTVTGHYGTIAGGKGNLAEASHSTVGGGERNIARGGHATIAGGNHNETTGSGLDTVGGGYENHAGGDASTISGGYQNLTTQWAATISGGTANEASGLEAVVGGGGHNTASAIHATVSGGVRNSSGFQATVGGGSDNRADGVRCTVSGGGNNLAQNYDATVGGGYGNIANGFQSTGPAAPPIRPAATSVSQQAVAPRPCTRALSFGATASMPTWLRPRPTSFSFVLRAG